MPKKIFLLGAAYVLLATAFTLGLGHLNWVQYNSLCHQGVKATARVTRFEPQNHNSFFYSYAIGGHVYEGGGHPYGWHPQPGEMVDIFYVPTDPAISCYGNPQDLRRNETIFIASVAIIFPALILAALFSPKFSGRLPFLNWLS